MTDALFPEAQSKSPEHAGTSFLENLDPRVLNKIRTFLLENSVNNAENAKEQTFFSTFLAPVSAPDKASDTQSMANVVIESSVDVRKKFGSTHRKREM